MMNLESKKTAKINDKIKIFLHCANIYFICSLVEMVISFGSVKAIGFSIFLLLENIVLLALALLALLFCIITFRKRNKFDFIAIVLVILGTAVMTYCFGKAISSMTLPYYYWSIDKYFVIFYWMNKYSDLAMPSLVSSQVIVNFNIIISTIMMISYFVLNFKLKERENVE